MHTEAMIERLFETLISGDRAATRNVVHQAEESLGSAESVITDLFWPTHQQIDKLFRSDQLAPLNHHLATRLLRVMVDQTSSRLKISPPRNRTIFSVCGPSESEELGAQMAVDLLEAAGFHIFFAGGGVAPDEILSRVQEDKPDVLLMFSSAAQDLPGIREMIDRIREIGACPNLQVAVGGGVFNRADGLAEEIGADIWATSPLEMVDCLLGEPERRAAVNQRTVGRNRKKRVAA